MQSVIWQINAFDQWGVQLGKVLSEKMVGAIDQTEDSDPIDSSTMGLITQIRRAKKSTL